MDSLQRSMPAAKYSLRHPQALFTGKSLPVILRKVVRCSSGAIPPRDRRIYLAGTPRRGRGGRARRPGSSFGALCQRLLGEVWRWTCSKKHEALDSQSFSGFMQVEDSNNCFNRSTRNVTVCAVASLRRTNRAILARCRLSMC